MSDIVVKVPTLHLYISPFGFHRYASEFLKAAKGFQKTNAFSPVPYYLFSRSIELSLKAFLLTKGFSKRTLKEKFGHDLEEALNKSVSLGLDDIVVISCLYKDNIKKANNYYASKGFEYFEVCKAVMGYPNLPSLDVLSEIASTLVSKLEQICIKARNGPV